MCNVFVGEQAFSRLFDALQIVPIGRVGHHDVHARHVVFAVETPHMQVMHVAHTIDLLQAPTDMFVIDLTWHALQHHVERQPQIAHHIIQHKQRHADRQNRV